MGISNTVEVAVSPTSLREVGAGNWLLSALCWMVAMVEEGSILIEK